MKSKDGHLSKIIRQSPKGIINRDRLFRLLVRKMDRRIIWVSAPPGSGKTVLVSSFIEKKKLGCLWYQMDKGDDDIATFFYYMGLAGKNAAPWEKDRLPMLTPEYLSGIAIFTRRYFENLYGRLRYPSTIVFDNYHELHPDSKLHELLAEGLAIAPDGINVIIISRINPPAVFSRLLAKDMIHFIGWDDIKFTMQESKKLIRARGFKKIPEDTIKQLHAKTEGWAAGLILMLERARLENIEGPSIIPRSTPGVFDYFATEIFRQVDAKMQDFFLKTAFLPKMTIGMIEKLMGYPPPERILENLADSHYFTSRHAGSEAVYQYHDLFRGFLISRAMNVWSRKTLSEVQRRAGMVLEKEGHIEDAVALFYQSQDWTEVIRLILLHAKELISQGRNQTLEAWLRGIPDALRENNPWLIYWFGACRLPFNPGESHAYFAKAFKLLTKNKDKNGIFMAWTGAVDSVFYGLGNYRLYDPWINIMEKLVKKRKDFPSTEIEKIAVAKMLFALNFRQHFNPKIKKWLNRATLLLESSDTIELRIQLSTIIALYYSTVGDISMEDTIIAPLRKLTYSDQISPLTFLTLKVIEVLYSWYTAVSDPEFKALYDGIKVAETTGIQVMDHPLLTFGAAWMLSSGNVQHGRQLLQKISKTIGQAGAYDRALYYIVSTGEAMMREDFVSTYDSQKTGMKPAIETGDVNLIVLTSLQMSQILHELSEDTRALYYLNKTYRICRKQRHFKYMYLIAKALFAFDQHNERSGLRFLRRAMQLGQDMGYVNFPGWRPSAMAKLCVKALEAGINKEYVKSLIKKRNLMPDTPPLECKDWPWPVKVFTLGSPKLFIEDKQLGFNGKVPQKPVELLQVLLASGGEDVSEEHIIDALWEDADGDRAKHAFDTNLHRLRKLLGNDRAIVFNAGKLTLDKRYCWVDTWAIEHWLDKAETFLKNHPVNTGTGSRKRHKYSASGIRTSHGVQDGISSIISHILSIYRGTFLGKELSHPWAENYRERLQRRLLNILEEAGQYCEANGEWKAAIEYYNKGLMVDHLQEIFYQRLMACYILIGQNAEAISIYHSCYKNLKENLGIEPSSKTREIYTSLQRKY